MLLGKFLELFILLTAISQLNVGVVQGVVLTVGLAAIGQGHCGSSKQAQVPVPWPESNCAFPEER